MMSLLWWVVLAVLGLAGLVYLQLATAEHQLVHVNWALDRDVAGAAARAELLAWLTADLREPLEVLERAAAGLDPSRDAEAVQRLRAGIARLRAVADDLAVLADRPIALAAAPTTLVHRSAA